jgi:hypothetical protein
MNRRALVVLALAGCSFIGVRGPSVPVKRDKPVECSDNYAAPIADGIFVGLATAAIVNGFLCDAPEGSWGCLGSGMLALAGGVVALVDVPSALYGYTTVGDCRRAQHEQRALRATNDSVPK